VEGTRRSIDRAERMRGRFRRNKPGENNIERVLEWKSTEDHRSAKSASFLAALGCAGSSLRFASLRAEDQDYHRWPKL